MKTVLFLVNGFGVEAKDSYSVYSAENMPNFDKLSRKYMFSKLTSNVFTTIDGFRNMSLELNDLYNYGIYEKNALNNKIASNPTVSVLNKTLIERKSKLHLLCFVDTSVKIVENLKNFVTLINKDKDKKVFVHVILTSKNYQDFPMILEVLSKINIELEGMATMGMVMGLANILNSNPTVELNFLLRTMISEVGERWASFKQKLEVSYGTKSAPLSVKPFVVNTGFSVSNNDLFMIWNYDNVDLTNFIDGVKHIDYGKDVTNNIAFFSLFPITYREKLHNILNYEVASNSLTTNMKGLGFKTMVMCDRDEVSGINYYLNGMQMINNPDITFICLDDRKYDPATVVSVVNGYPQEFVIINYNVPKVETVEELLDFYKKIDTVLGALYDNTEKNSYNIVISSLYPINITVPNAKGENCNIICEKEPIVYVDNFITKKDYLLNEGNTSDLFKVCYKSINKTYPGQSLVIKKNVLYRMIFK